MKPLRILVISSVIPDEAAMGGPLILKRHFDNPELDVRVFRSESMPAAAQRFAQISRCGLHAAARTLNSFMPPLPDQVEIDSEIQAHKPDLILSVAHGWYFLAAAAATKRHGIPLVLWCQDWWPDFPQVAPIARKRVRDSLLRVCQQAKQIICISKGMHEAIGAPPNSVVLHDLPSKVSPDQAQPKRAIPYRVIYGGNIGEYGPMVGEAAANCLRGGKVRIDVYGGPRPGWSGEIARRLREADAFHGLFRSGAFLERIRESHAVLITQPFTADAAHRMRTCFPSKLIEMAQLHKPMIIWGPEYGSAVRWARERNSALCITDPSPEAVRRKAEALAEDPEQHEHLSRASAEAAARDFNPDKIREAFVELLRQACV